MSQTAIIAAQGLTGILIKLKQKTENAYASQWRAAPRER